MRLSWKDILRILYMSALRRRMCSWKHRKNFHHKGRRFTSTCVWFLTIGPSNLDNIQNSFLRKKASLICALDSSFYQLHHWKSSKLQKKLFKTVQKAYIVPEFILLRMASRSKAQSENNLQCGFYIFWLHKASDSLLCVQIRNTEKSRIPRRKIKTKMGDYIEMYMTEWNTPCWSAPL